MITTFLLLSVLSIFSLALFSRSNTYLVASERNKNKIVAFNMAEAGLDLALTQLAGSPAYAGTKGYVSMNTNTVRGGYKVTVTTAANNPNVRQILVDGYSPSNVTTARAYEMRSVTGFAQVGVSSNNDFAVFARESIHMSGNARINSYNSKNGPYDPKTATSRGHIGTNNARNGFVMLSGNARIQGNVAVGLGGATTVNTSGYATADAPRSPNSVVTMSGNAVIQSVTNISQTKTFEPVPAPPSSGTLQLSGNTVYKLPAGEYHYSDLSITGNAKLEPLGPVKLHVDGKIQISGNGIVTSESKPSNLFLYARGSSPVSFSGNAHFYGVIHAPNSEVKNTGNGHIYGSVIAKNYHDNGNGQVHYDEALNTVGGSSNSVDLLSWRESNTTAGSVGGSGYSSGNKNPGTGRGCPLPQ